jgi:hypothetical protein
MSLYILSRRRVSFLRPFEKTHTAGFTPLILPPALRAGARRPSGRRVLPTFNRPFSAPNRRPGSRLSHPARASMEERLRVPPRAGPASGVRRFFSAVPRRTPKAPLPGEPDEPYRRAPAGGRLGKTSPSPRGRLSDYASCVVIDIPVTDPSPRRL